MTYVVVVMPRAARQAREINAWWRRNRTAAPRQFEDDFDQLLASLERHPSRGAPYRRGRLLRFLITTRTHHRVLYRVRMRAGRVEVISVGL